MKHRGRLPYSIFLLSFRYLFCWQFGMSILWLRAYVRNQIDDWKLMYASLLLRRSLGIVLYKYKNIIQVSRIISIGIDSKLIGSQFNEFCNLASSSVIIICAIFYWNGKKPYLRTMLQTWVINFIPICNYSCSTYM